LKIWIDNDGCPRVVRDHVFRMALKRQVHVVVVANTFFHAPSASVEVVVVNGDFNAADDHIAEQVGPGELVITSDVPLADRIVSSGGIAINSKGDIFDASNIKEKLAMRDLSHELRGAGMIRQGGQPLSQRDFGSFANAFDRILTKLSRQSLKT
jgi:uncharacterized protein